MTKITNKQIIEKLQGEGEEQYSPCNSCDNPDGICCEADQLICLHRNEMLRNPEDERGLYGRNE